MHEQEDWRIKRISVVGRGCFKNAKLEYWEYSWEEMNKWEKKSCLSVLIYCSDLTSELFPIPAVRLSVSIDSAMLLLQSIGWGARGGGGVKSNESWEDVYQFQTTAYMMSYPGFLAISWLPNTLQTPVCPTAKTSARVTSLKTVTDALVLISMTSSRHVDWWRGKTCSGWTNIIDLHPCTVFSLDDARFKVSKVHMIL